MVELHHQDSATTVRIRIGATGQVPVPELAVTVATAIRTLS
ncbi:hypothetical protein [Paenarthrobacter sp. Z7-10]|nr:hypothetical protein [Paenarthrobacter sp. Z7-10]